MPALTRWQSLKQPIVIGIGSAQGGPWMILAWFGISTLILTAIQNSHKKKSLNAKSSDFHMQKWAFRLLKQLEGKNVCQTLLFFKHLLDLDI